MVVRLRNSTWVVGILFCLGCHSGPRLYDVSGIVTFDGKPVDEGEMILVAADNSVAPDVGKIEGGEFHFKAKAGKKKVQIRASRKVPGQGPMGENFVYDSYIPHRYNDETTLEAEVSTTSDNHFRFELQPDKE